MMVSIKEICAAVALLLASSVAAAPPPSTSTTSTSKASTTSTSSATCSDHPLRREWREVSEDVRQDFIRAVLCLKAAPSKLARSLASPSRLDDAAYLHARVLATAHGTAPFLPWHRAFLNAFEHMLKHECGYHHQLLYWDWSVDSQAADQSSIWRIDHLGGDGDPDDNYCVKTGHFAGFRTTFGAEGCLQRHYTHSETNTGLRFGQASYTPEAIHNIVTSLYSPTYNDLNRNVMFSCHAAIHDGMTGTMSNVPASSGDPVFFLHHANVDRLWRMWQKVNPSLANTFNGDYLDGKPASPKQVMKMHGLVPGLKEFEVWQMLRTNSADPLCYEYSNSIRGGVDATGNVIAGLSISNKFGISVSGYDGVGSIKFRPYDDPFAHDASIIAAEKPSQNQKRDNVIDAEIVSARVGSNGNDTHAKLSDSVSHLSAASIPPISGNINTRLACGTRISDGMLHRMRMDQHQINHLRSMETDMCNFIHFLNEQVPEYMSPAAKVRVSLGVFHSVSDQEAAAEAQTSQELYKLYKLAVENASSS